MDTATLHKISMFRALRAGLEDIQRQYSAMERELVSTLRKELAAELLGLSEERVNQVRAEIASEQERRPR